MCVAFKQADVNVIAWNVLTPHTLASGGDEGRLRVWDLRAFEQPVADFNHHRCTDCCTASSDALQPGWRPPVESCWRGLTALCSAYSGDFRHDSSAAVPA